MQKILEAKVEQDQDNKWYKTHRIFDWPLDSTLSYRNNRELFEKNVVEPVNNLNWVLKILVRYIHDSDHIIARSCYELGQVLEFYGALSQAYIAYCLGRHYNNRDRDILNSIKAVKVRLVKKMYKIPNFRKYFPRTEEHRFEYELLKEQILAAKTDTSDLKKPVFLVKKKKVGLPFPVEMIYVFGLTIMIFCIGFFMKTRKK